MTTVWSGLTLGAIYAIVAIGYNLIFVASRVFNFAQAQFVMLGAFVALEAGTALKLPLILAIVLAAAVGGIIGGLEELLAVRRLAGHGVHNELVTTLGVGIILSGIALAIFGSNPQQLSYFSNEQPFTFIGGRVVLANLLVIAAAVVIAGAVVIVMRRSMVGLASLATSEDREASMLRGVNVKRLSLGAFIIAGALVAAAGPLVGATTYAVYDLGDALAIKSFVALAIGGFGSFPGALIGGFAVGLLEEFGARYLGTGLQNITVFVILLIVLLVLPRGIFGRSAERAV